VGLETACSSGQNLAASMFLLVSVGLLRLIDGGRPQGQSHRQAADHGEQLERAERVRGHCSAAVGGLEW